MKFGKRIRVLTFSEFNGCRKSWVFFLLKPWLLSWKKLHVPLALDQMLSPLGGKNNLSPAIFFNSYVWIIIAPFINNPIVIYLVHKQHIWLLYLGVVGKNHFWPITLHGSYLCLYWSKFKKLHKVWKAFFKGYNLRPTATC